MKNTITMNISPSWGTAWPCREHVVSQAPLSNMPHPGAYSALRPGASSLGLPQGHLSPSPSSSSFYDVFFRNDKKSMYETSSVRSMDLLLYYYSLSWVVT
eukprot:TRINITY_DN4796_c0_g1_i1.p1 TRINITY_DN4796_c0_g1~~TRINITY_DN4796_c0_g1_i1.p1  ORF type:complete len:100 (+),score=8.38 TRINITY_DN4796_c0_g1_i1:89-388(+)